MGPEFKTLGLEDGDGVLFDVGDRARYCINGGFIHGTVIGSSNDGQILVKIDEQDIQTAFDRGYRLFSSNEGRIFFDEYGHTIKNDTQDIFLDSPRAFKMIQKVNRLKKIDVDGNLW